MKNEQMLESATSRRTLLVGVGSVGAVTALAACGTESDTPSTSSGAGADPTTGAPATTGAGETGAPAATGGSGTAAGFAKTADVPVGSGKIYATQKVVVTQPTEGTFKCFSNICTHQGCPVTSVDGGSITCKCHNSIFSIEDGSPTSGPAKKALEEKQITVEGDSIVLA